MGVESLVHKRGKSATAKSATCDAKIEQDAENALKKTESQHEKDKRTAVDNAIHQASLEVELNAAEKAADKSMSSVPGSQLRTR